jgi:hypothetical protein
MRDANVDGNCFTDAAVGSHPSAGTVFSLSQDSESKIQFVVIMTLGSNT